MSDVPEDFYLNLMIMSGAALIMADAAERHKKKRKRRWWQVKIYESRQQENALLGEMRDQASSGHYKNFTRMTPFDFQFLLDKITPRIAKKDTRFREAISAETRLAITLRFLASGESYTSLQYLFRVSKQAIGYIVPEVCTALIEELKGYIKCPTDSASWKNISEQFEQRWNFPHCLGALDGKHIALQAPFNSGSEFFNYKSFFSIVLLALVDADYNFIFVDVGCQGRISDGGVFKNCKLHSMLTEKTLNLPEEEELPGRQMKLPHFFIADAAFPLGENMMKPYAGDHPKGSMKRIFNFRLSRARRVVENAFGILSSIFRVLRKTMLLEPNKAEKIVLTTVLLHNFLKTRSPNVYMPPGSVDTETEEGVIIPGSWRADNNPSSMQGMRIIPRRTASYPEKVRAELADYCIKEGALPWQHLYA